MLRALRTSVMALALRRCIAMVLTLCVCVAFAEPGLADSCDADATALRTQAASVQAASGQAGVSEVEPLQSGAQTAVEIVADRTSSSIPAPSAPIHDIHVCHCVHAHVAPLGRRQMLSTVPTYPGLVRAMHSDRTPPSVVQEPQLRPPRALSVA